MSERGEPIYKSRRHAPEAARFGRCQRINDFILMSEGSSNTYLVETGEGNILINSGMGFEAPVHHANYRDLRGEIDGSLRKLIFTQGHVDHVGGTRYFRDRNPGLQVIAQANNPEHQAYDGRLGPFRGARSAFAFTQKFADAFAYYAEQGYTEFPPQDAPTPDLLFEDRHCFSLGGLDVELIGVPGAETNDSLVLWLPQHRICFTGNLFGCPFGHFPNLVTIRGDRYRDALTVANAVQVVRDLGAEMICYGHHGPVVGAELIDAELAALHGAILHVHDAVVEGMNNGAQLHDLMRDISLPPELEVGEGYGKVSWSVRAIWENYAGWFKHASTTELYAGPQSSVHADLVALAGADALVQRAADKLADGAAEQALHLLDIVLQAEPGHGAATAVAIQAHEALLAESGNFWLSAWLKNQVQQLRA